MEASPFRVNVFLNSKSKSREGGKVVVVTPNLKWDEFLQRVTTKLELRKLQPAKRIFNSDGGEISDVEELLADDVLFVSLGEPFGSDPAPYVPPYLVETSTSTSSTSTNSAGIEGLKEELSEEFLAQQLLAYERIQKAAEDKKRKEQEEQERKEKEDDAELARKVEKEEQKKLNDAADQRVFECEICYGDMRAANMYIIDECYHKFCTECMEEYLKVQILDGGQLKHEKISVLRPASHVIEIKTEEQKGIKCPAQGCDHILQHDEIRHCASANVFTTFDSMLFDQFLESADDIKWCPRENCTGVILQSPRNPKLAVCISPGCNYTWCFECKTEYHDEVADCKLWQLFQLKKKNADLLFYDWAKAKDVRGCPKCGTLIEKNGGCDNMYCTKCQTAFVWTETSLAWYKTGEKAKHYGMMVKQKKHRRKGARRKGLI